MEADQVSDDGEEQEQENDDASEDFPEEIDVQLQDMQNYRQTPSYGARDGLITSAQKLAMTGGNSKNSTFTNPGT